MALLAKDYVYEKIQEKIFSGSIPLGARISEHALSKELNVSRTPIREALARLVYEGVAEQVPNDGIFLRRPSLKDIEEIYDLREILESHAAYRAAQNALPIHLEKMENSLCLLEKMFFVEKELGDINARWHFLVRQFELPFHAAVIHAANNARLAAVASNMQMLVKAFNCVQFSEENVSDAAVRSTMEQHREIYEGIQNKNPEKASQAMREHIQTGLKSALRNFELAQRIHSAEKIKVLE